MNLNLYDKNLNRILIIGTNYKSCLWNEGYNSVEPFTLELANTKEIKEKAKEDYYIGRDDRETLMVIKGIEIKPSVIILTGFQASRVLDDVAFLGTISENRNIDDSLYDAYNGSTKMRNLEYRKSGVSSTYPGQLSDKSILGLMEIMCEDDDCGFRTIRNGSKLITELYKPTLNENLIFSEEFGNLKYKNIKISTEKNKNFAFVLGSGEGDARTVVTVDLTNGEERKEIIIDARDIQPNEEESEDEYKDRLFARGLEKLLEMNGVFSISATPSANDFGKRYDLGDLITIRLREYGISMTARVSRFTQKSQGNLVETTVEVGRIAKIKRR